MWTSNVLLVTRKLNFRLRDVRGLCRLDEEMVAAVDQLYFFEIFNFSMNY